MRAAILAALFAVIQSIPLVSSAECAYGGVAGSIVDYQDDRLTVRLIEADLSDVVAEITKQSGAALRGSVAKGQTVNRSFENEPLDRALERLLSPQSFMLAYDATGHLRTIELFPSEGDGADLRALPPPVQLTRNGPFEQNGGGHAAVAVAAPARRDLSDLYLPDGMAKLLGRLLKENNPAEFIPTLEARFGDRTASIVDEIAQGAGPPALQELAQAALALRIESTP